MTDKKSSATEKQAAPKNKGGRPSTYDPDIARIMCEYLSEGVPLREICRKEGFPAWRTVYDWMRKDPDLTAAIAHARDVGYDAMAEECLTIADTPLLGEEVSESETPEGKKAVVNPALCKGDGLCCSQCPTDAIALQRQTATEIRHQPGTALRMPECRFRRVKRVFGFFCRKGRGDDEKCTTKNESNCVFHIHNP